MKYLRRIVVIQAGPVHSVRTYPFQFILLACLALLLTGCSQEKDAFLNRTYHRLTARDNGWFNANEKLKEVVAGIEDGYRDDYDEVLPLFVYGTEDQARGAIPDLEKCIDKCSLVIERHKMDIKGEEKNKWIDDAYFVIAKSQFYKRNYSEAERGFEYISRKYKGQNKQHESLIWLARTAIQMEQYAKAQTALDKVKEEKKLPKKFDHGQLSAVQADLDLERGKVDDAIVNLEHAIPLAKTKREKVRWSFVLAQLYQVKSQEDNAIQQFADVVKMGPPYEMSFHAQIFQAMAFNKGNSKALRQKLNRMLKDEKHIDHFDMIHYALADIDLKEDKKEDALVNLRTSAQISTTDTRQKAKSFMKLADIFFEDRLYSDAQKYYDSTRTLLSEEHVRFDEVDTRADVLGDLVEQLAIIALEDSLQGLASLDEAELEKKVKDIIRDRERAEAEALRLEEEARERAETETPAVKPPAGGGGSGGNWYFYDAQQISRGLTQFRKRWGTRKLEDDWRRKDKSGSALAENFAEEAEEVLEESAAEEGEPEWKDVSFYTKSLPKDEAAMEASNARICSALYVSGMIYKEQLKDIDNATESFEVLNNRFDDCQYTPESYYQLYRIYLEKENAGWFSLDGIGSQTYANIITERWPDSEFARLVRDPNIMQADEARRQQEEAAYRKVYQSFRQYAYTTVIAAADSVIANEPDNHFLPKYHMLRAMSIGGMRDLNGFRAGLTAITTQFAGTDEARAAEELLANMDKSAAPPPQEPKDQVNYKTDQGQHYFALIVPNEGNDMNSIKAKISNFNQALFSGMSIQITNSFLDPQHQVVLLSFFDSKVKAMEYYTMFKDDRSMLQGINDQGFQAFAISPDNYSQLFKNKDVEGYTSFFTQNYLGNSP